MKETYNTVGDLMTPVTQFTFHLDGQQNVYSNGLGIADFVNVTPGLHIVTEDVPPFWMQTAVTPAGGLVIVNPGNICAVVTFKNRQYLPAESSSSTQSYVPPQCSDGLDNEGDGDADFFDAGCHTDGKAGNPLSYDADDTTETSVSGVRNCKWSWSGVRWTKSCL